MDSVFNRPTIKTQPGQPTLENRRGFRVDLSGIQSAYKPVQINSRGFVAGELALGEIGKGLEGLGGSLDKIQGEMTKAVNERHLAEAEMTLQQAKVDIAAEIAQHPNNPELWESIASKRIAEAQRIALPKGASPLAQQAFEPFALKWGISAVGETKVSAIRRQFDLTSETFGAGYQKALNDRDYGGAMGWLDRWEQSGTIAKDVAEQRRGNVLRQRESDMAGDYKAAVATAVMNEDYLGKAALDEQAFKGGILSPDEYKLEQTINVRGQLVKDIKDQIQTDPRAAKQTIADIELPDTDRRNLLHLADSTLNEYRQDELRQIGDEVATGAIQRGDEVKFNWIDSPAEQLEWRTKIDQAPMTVEELVPEMLSLESAITQFDVEALDAKDSAATRQMVEISARVSKLPTHVKARISDKWQGRLSGKAPTTKETYVSEGQKIIGELYQTEESKFFATKGSSKFLKDAKAANDWASFKLRMTKMDNDLKQLMPDNPTPEQAFEIIQQVTGSAATSTRKKAYQSTDDTWSIPMRPDSSNPTMGMPTGSAAFPIRKSLLLPNP
jgi:hypothetical protein